MNLLSAPGSRRPARPDRGRGQVRATPCSAPVPFLTTDAVLAGSPPAPVSSQSQFPSQGCFQGCAGRAGQAPAGMHGALWEEHGHLHALFLCVPVRLCARMFVSVPRVSVSICALLSAASPQWGVPCPGQSWSPSLDSEGRPGRRAGPSEEAGFGAWVDVSPETSAGAALLASGSAAQLTRP